MKNRITQTFFFWLLILNVYAQDIFIKHYGEFSGTGNCVVADGQGNFFLAGHKYVSTNYDQFYLYKIDSNGDTIWKKLFGGPLYDQAMEIIPTIDGEFVIAGKSSNLVSSINQITLMKVSSSGNLTWTKSIGGASYEAASCIVELPSGEFFVGGKKRNSASQDDFYLLKTNSQGDTLWTKTYGGLADESINSIDLCFDGGVILAGYTDSFGPGSRDYYVVKVDSAGNVQWSKTYGSALPDAANDVKQTTDGGYVIAGYSHKTLPTSNIFVVKTNAQGDTLWTRTLSAQNNMYFAHDIIQTQDGGYAVAGSVEMWQTNSPGNLSAIRVDAVLMKLTANGQIAATKQYSVAVGVAPPCITGALANSIIQLPDESTVIGGTYFDCSTNQMLLIKTRDIGPAFIDEMKIPELVIFPNPSPEKVEIQLGAAPSDYTLILFDPTGVQVQNTGFQQTSRCVIIKNNLSTGIYFFHLTSISGKTYSGKIAFE